MMMIIAKSLSQCSEIKNKRKLRPIKTELSKKLHRRLNELLSRIDRTKSIEKSKLRRKSNSMKIYFQAKKLLNMKRTYKIGSRMSFLKPRKEPKRWI